MHSIIQRELERATRILNQIQFKYAIQDSDGVIHGELKVPEEKSEKKLPKYPRNSIRDWIAPHIQVLSRGKVGLIPYGEFDRDSVQSGACSQANKKWGAYNYTTHMTVEGIEIYVYPEGESNGQQNII
jgi:hypothetical protein